MPVPHHPLLTREMEERGQEDLLDGVNPENHPETYGYLLELRCVTSLVIFLWQSLEDGHKICDRCYANASREEKTTYALVFPHNLVHKTSADHQKNCTFCNKIIINIKPASECRGCIGVAEFTSRQYLDDGWGAPVFDEMEE